MSDQEDQDDIIKNSADHNGNASLADKIPANKTITIEKEMKKSYLDYAMSVIVSRAIPDVRDGLKPVHRRILWSMTESDFTHQKPYKKSARIVGDVIGKYHPHSDQAVYDALVRMAQPFSLGISLIDGQGNFGSIDGDAPAAMRYTEARMAKPAAYLVADIDKETVPFASNYDNSEKEPKVLPAQFPNILVGGTGGIAVGMATNIPPHNLGEVIDATMAMIDNPSITQDELCQIVLGPDFPTNGVIIGNHGARLGLLTGRGSVIVRGVSNIEQITKDKQAIIVTEIPYQVNKSLMIERIAVAVRDKRIEGISNLRDESNRLGIRVVMELKRDAVADVVLNQLYRYSQLQNNIGINMLALADGKPQQLTLISILTIFISFRKEVVTNRTKFELLKARNRAHILVGLAIAVANIDEMVLIIRSASSPAHAHELLAAKVWDAQDMIAVIKLVDDPFYKLSDDQTKLKLSNKQIKAILELRLQRLTALGRDEITDEMKRLSLRIADYLDILGNIERVLTIIKGELSEIKEKFAIPRQTKIIEADIDIFDEDLITPEEMVVTLSSSGYIKRTALASYRSQRRGGKGRFGMSTKDEDFVADLLIGETHTKLVFFTNKGMCYKLPLWRLPLGSPTAKGKALVNLLPLSQDEKVTNILPLPKNDQDAEKQFVIFATQNGYIRRNKLSDFLSINRGGKIAMKFQQETQQGNREDKIIGVSVCLEDDDILLTTSFGNAIRFAVADLRVFSGRSSIGVRGIKLAVTKEDKDMVISLAVLNSGHNDLELRKAFLKYMSPKRTDNIVDGEVCEEIEDAKNSKDGVSSEDVPSADVPSADVSSEDVPSADVCLSDELIEQMKNDEQILMFVTENGFGKRTSIYEFRRSGRGGQGVKAMQCTQKNGKLINSFICKESDEIMLVTDGGKLIRTNVKDVRIMGRNTQGVGIIKTDSKEKVVSSRPIAEGNIDDIDDIDEDDS